MDFSELFQSLQGSLGETLLRVVGALAILVVGWLLVIFIRGLIRRGLGMAGVNRRVESATGKQIDVEGGTATAVYYLLLLMVVVAFLNVLQLQFVSAPLQSLLDRVFSFLPSLAAAAILALVAFLLATVLRTVATKALAATTLDERLSREAGMKPISASLGNVLYWLVFLLFLPGILGALQLRGLLDPIQGMVDDILAMVPNVVAAVLIGLVGWLVARILRDLVSNLLAATGADTLGAKAGLRETAPLSRLVGLLVFLFVLIPALVAALDALKIEAISRPATQVLGAVMAAIPNVFAAVVIIGVTFFVARFAAGIIAELLHGVNFDEVPAKLGIDRAFPPPVTASRVVGQIFLIFAMVFAVVEAANRLAFTQVADLVATLLRFGGQVLLGAAIIAVGLWISKLAYTAIRGVGGPDSALPASLARFAILGLVFAMGLRAMDVANTIVNLAFGFTLGAVAVAVALSFGLGGREAAGRQMEHWLSRLRGE